jgi:hypothetical protein
VQPLASAMVLGPMLGRSSSRALALLIARISPLAPPPTPEQGTVNCAALAAGALKSQTATATKLAKTSGGCIPPKLLLLPDRATTTTPSRGIPSRSQRTPADRPKATAPGPDENHLDEPELGKPAHDRGVSAVGLHAAIVVFGH